MSSYYQMLHTQEFKFLKICQNPSVIKPPPLQQCKEIHSLLKAALPFYLIAALLLLSITDILCMFNFHQKAEGRHLCSV